MYVKHYLILLLLACTACGLAVIGIMSYYSYREGRAATMVKNGDLALRDMGTIESGFSQWMLLSDLVIGSDESYLANGAINLSEELTKALDQIKIGLTENTAQDIKEIERFVSRQQARLEETHQIPAKSRTARLSELLEEMDAESSDCIVAIDSLRSKLESNQRAYYSEFKSLVSFRPARITALLLGFLLIVIALWRWISRMLSKPLSRLTQELRQAKNEQRQLNIVNAGPIEFQHLSGSFSDLIVSLTEQIEELRRTRAERAKLNNELIDASRKAGMAEVASEVLHNVGNVLNSMNVSTTVITKQLDESVLSRMVQVNEMLAENLSDLPGYLTNDERGKHLPRAIDHLTKSLTTEQEKQRAELDLLQDSIAHVRKVIRNQQAFARGTNVLESVCVIDIIEEAIRINESSIAASNVTIVREFTAESNAETDRHKVQQILVNLISNAIDATAEVENNKRTVRIVLQDHGADFCVKLIDNGIGIPANKLDEIFTHGFTTKKHGHGFGLHSSAIAAKVLGGSLDVHSDGKGTGATFTLRLPREERDQIEPESNAGALVLGVEMPSMPGVNVPAS